MDAIEALDDGAAAHFGYQAGRYPDILPFMRPAYYLGSYVGIGVLLAIIVLLFLVQGKRRSALVAFLSVASAFALIEVIRLVVPRARPLTTDQLLGPIDRLGSYPSSSVFLFTLCMVLLAFALWHWMRRPWQRGAYVLIAALLTAWICMAGFFLSLHYVTDLIGGLAGAALFSWIASRLMDPSLSASEGR